MPEPVDLDRERDNTIVESGHISDEERQKLLDSGRVIEVRDTSGRAHLIEPWRPMSPRLRQALTDLQLNVARNLRALVSLHSKEDPIRSGSERQGGEL